MNWFEQALRVFNVEKPDHFGNYRHCEECEEHDETLRQFDVHSIGLTELGNPGWDPICFSHPQGTQYYLPAMIRLAVDSMDTDFYLSQLLFHLEYDGDSNALVAACTDAQRAFIVRFIEWTVLNFSHRIEEFRCEGEVFRVLDIWSKPAESTP